jgi:hypothetical protein
MLQRLLLLFCCIVLIHATNLLDHAYASCLDSVECMAMFELTSAENFEERRKFDIVFDHLLSKESKKNFKLAKNNNTLTAQLYWGVCESAEKVGVYCKRKVSRSEIDDMLTEMDSKKCGGVKR